MKTLFNSSSKLKNEKGVVLVYVAILLVVFLGIAALAVDIGYLMVGKTELQRTADAAALAATRQLGVIYEGMSYANQRTYNAATDEALIKSAATNVALQNRATGTSEIIDPADIQIGRWDPTAANSFTAGLLQPNAVQVVNRRDDASSTGRVGTFFARIFNITGVEVRATATAALTGESTAGPGGLPVPVGISYAWFRNLGANNFCNQPIRFYPTNDPSSCGGWHVYDRYNNAPDSRLRATIGDIESNAWQNDEVIAGSTIFRFTNGTMSTQTYDAMYSLFNSRRSMDNDGNDLTWTATVPVYAPTPSDGGLDAADCGSPHIEMIYGFATIVISGVSPPPVHQIDGYVICNNVEAGRGGGVNAGTLGSIPGLVQ
jgi:Flp pilus assembly protein TadG